MTRRVFHVLCSLLLSGQMGPAALAAESQPDLNFKIYSPAPSSGSASSEPDAQKNDGAESGKPAENSAAGSGAVDSMWTDSSSSSGNSGGSTSPTAAETPTPASEAPAAPTSLTPAEPALDGKTSDTAGKASNMNGKVLQGYIRVVPSGTKIPIIMDSAVDSDTSQEGDEFAARTGEDLNIDGNTVIPAGSVIKGRIAQLNAPKHMGRSGSVALKFDTVTTPDNRQIPLVATLVAHGGVVHARRGLKDIAIDTGTFMAPTAIGLGIGVLAGGAKGGSTSKSHIGRGGGALIGAGVGAAVGVAILCIKKGKKVDVRPGDELKIELAEDLRMPM